MIPDAADLVRRFEPILHFHEDERFFPSDAKRYGEACALWSGPGDDKTRWGPGAPALPRTPRIARGDLSLREGEPGQFLGSPPPPDLLKSDAFLDAQGWWNGADAATAATDNRYADLGELAQRYNDPGADAAARKLSESRFWYHAEVYDTARLLRLTGRGNRDAPPGYTSTTRRVALALKNPVLLCYYLFYPGVDDPLEGCETAFLGELFGSFAGCWHCVAILLEEPARDPNSVPVDGDLFVDYAPRYIGVTSRNVGAIDFLGDSRRFGMKVFDWKDARPETRVRVGRPLGQHPRLFVARGNHGLYLTPGVKPAAAFAPDDPTRGWCGSREDLSQPQQSWPTKSKGGGGLDWWEWLLIFLLGPLAPIFIVAGRGGGGLTAVGGLASAPAQKDHPPDAGAYGKVIHPKGVNPPDLNADAEKIVWPAAQDERTLASTVDGRFYALLVDRADPDRRKRPLWLRGDASGDRGFAGRWGPRVTNDPKDRRAGMAFPEYWEMFLSALAKKLSA
jgi:hypothetical protein